MKTIGLLGGMSWESSALYYRLINELVRDRLGGLHSAKIVMSSVDFAEIEETQRSGDWELAGKLLAAEAAHVEAAGADFLVICTNTMHKVTPEIEAAISIPLLHIVDAAAKVVTDAGIRTVGLLGTAFTMEQDFYRQRLESYGLTVLIPDEAERADIHRVIYEELVLGIVKDSSRERYREIIASLCERGVEGIILGCTEIELLVSGADSPVPLFPTTLIHAEAAVREALN
ncbi:MAG TPA: aspartate/glutamate racemase family protein [Galbitalea sp.]|jgi:aspartate racemase|nr:aspartate/glutamate racemase family protein [Galbitalea sp.]